MIRWCRSLVLGVILLWGCFAAAHDLGLTMVKVDHGTQNTKIQIITALSRLVESSQLSAEPSPADLDLAVRSRLQARVAQEATIKIDSESDLLVWSATVPEVDENQLLTRRFDESTTTARTIVATYREGKLDHERVLDGEPPRPSALAMMSTGIHHILSGLDHVLFVIGLALLGGNWKSLLKVLTAFTLAHTLTLACAILGLIRGNPRLVEPLIALSIVALAVEGIRQWKHPAEANNRIRVGIAFGFGLLHGFGFAGGLIGLGAQGSLLVSNVATFSVGIELGQLAILLPTVLVMAGVRRFGEEKTRSVSLAASVALGMAGSFWFVERIL